MKFYKRFVGDIMKKTAGLTMAQMGAYDRLLDYYFATEEPIEADEVYTVTHAKTPADHRDVDKVLRKYFGLGPNGYTHERADETIAEALPRIEAARENGKKGGRPSKAKLSTRDALKEPNGLFDGTNPVKESKTSQSQSQIGNTSVPNGTGGAPPEVRGASNGEPPSPKDVVFALGVALLTAAGVVERNARAFLALQCKGGREAEVAAALEACAEARPVEPIPWLQARLKRTGPAASKHSGFADKDYREGINDDGSFA